MYNFFSCLRTVIFTFVGKVVKYLLNICAWFSRYCESMQCIIGWSEKNFFFDIILLGVRKLDKCAKNTIKSVFVGLHAEMPLLSPFSGLAALNFQNFAITFDSDMVET